MDAASNPSSYDRYISEIIEDIKNTVEEFKCEPILFVGSGLSRRYMGTPSWEELLESLALDASTINKNLIYYKQQFGTLMAVGEEFSRLYREWAWSSGRNEFPSDMFSEGTDGRSYIKYKISQKLSSLTPQSITELSKDHEDEILSLARIRPHAIITTNYDQMLEIIFPDFEPVIGQKIIKGANYSVGEIYKIHGCVSEHDGIVLRNQIMKNFS